MRMPPLPADSIHARACKLKCEKILTRPESEVPVKLPYGYVLAGKEITAHEEKTDAVRGIFKYYLAGASLGKIVNMLFAKGLSFSTGHSK